MIKLTNANIALLLPAFVLCSCASHRVVSIEDAPNLHEPHFSWIDNRATEIPSNFFTQQGNVYSCHYGIKRLENHEIKPERLAYLLSQLDKLVGAKLAGNTFTIKRFSIFSNDHINMKRNALAGALGGVAGALASAAYAGPELQSTVPDAVIQYQTDNDNFKDNNLRGCAMLARVNCCTESS